jgi:transposase-like protein
MEIKRFSIKKKTEIVLDLLKGASIEELSRQYNVTVQVLSDWQELFLKHGSMGFEKNTKDSRVSELECIIELQRVEIEQLYKRIKPLGDK